MGSNKLWTLLGGAALVALATPTLAQEAGWHYSPLPGEGDRAALGCSYGANPQHYTCLAVRCEDDFTVGLHIHTSRADGDAGKWRLEFDKGELAWTVTAAPDASPYHAKIDGDVPAILEALKLGAMVFLDPDGGLPLDRAISLKGSELAINRALYFCAPKIVSPPASGDQVPAVDGQDRPGNVPGEGTAEE